MKVGDRVRTHGRKVREELRPMVAGVDGVVLEGPREDGRWRVELEGSYWRVWCRPDELDITDDGGGERCAECSAPARDGVRDIPCELCGVEHVICYGCGLPLDGCSATIGA